MRERGSREEGKEGGEENTQILKRKVWRRYQLYYIREKGEGGGRRRKLRGSNRNKIREGEDIQ